MPTLWTVKVKGRATDLIKTLAEERLVAHAYIPDTLIVSSELDGESHIHGVEQFLEGLVRKGFIESFSRTTGQDVLAAFGGEDHARAISHIGATLTGRLLHRWELGPVHIETGLKRRFSKPLTLTFDSSLTEEQILRTLEAFGTYFRQVGGAGLTIDENFETLGAGAPAHV